jgi:hypothetical protein
MNIQIKIKAICYFYDFPFPLAFYQDGFLCGFQVLAVAHLALHTCIQLFSLAATEIIKSKTEEYMYMGHIKIISFQMVNVNAILRANVFKLIDFIPVMGIQVLSFHVNSIIRIQFFLQLDDCFISFIQSCSQCNHDVSLF